MNFMEEVNEETQAMLKQISIRKAEKKANANKRIAALKNLLNSGSKIYEVYQVWKPRESSKQYSN